MLDSYVAAFSKLRTDVNRKSWTAITNYRSPYKPFLLLSILDLIADGSITKNFIEPSIGLTETFQGYISVLPPMNRQASMAYPFVYLKSDGFWHLKERFGVDVKPAQTISTITRLRECYYGASFNDDLFPLLQMQTSRDKLRAALITTYFHPDIQPLLLEQATVNYESTNYSAALLTTKEVQQFQNYSEKSTVTTERIRDQGFRKAIVRLYDHRCALCGIKIITVENHTIVEAAHIIPWAESHDDHPTNGMALCRLCHWSFDEGLMSVNNEYHVMVSPTVMKNHNLPGHMVTLTDRPIFRPEESRFWPAQENFKWHRKKRYRQSE